MHLAWVHGHTYIPHYVNIRIIMHMYYSLCYIQYWHKIGICVNCV